MQEPETQNMKKNKNGYFELNEKFSEEEYIKNHF